MHNKKPKEATNVFSVDVPEDSSGYLLWRTTQAWQREIKKTLAPFNITHTQFVILAVTLWRTLTQESLTQIEVAHQAGLDKMTVSNVVRVFIKQDLMERRAHPTDTRAKTISLTGKGEALVRKLVPLVEETDKDFFGKLTEKKRQNFNSSLVKLITSVS